MTNSDILDRARCSLALCKFFLRQARERQKFSDTHPNTVEGLQAREDYYVSWKHFQQESDKLRHIVIDELDGDFPAYFDWIATAPAG